MQEIFNFKVNYHSLFFGKENATKSKIISFSRFSIFSIELILYFRNFHILDIYRQKIMKGLRNMFFERSKLFW